MKKLLEVIDENPKWQVMIPVLLLTGLRIGEFLGLYWSDIDYQQKIIYVTRAISKKYIETSEGKIICLGVQAGNTKTEQSVRELPVSDEVLDILKCWHNHIVGDTKWMKRIKEQKNHNLVFPNYMGRITKYNTIYKELKAFLKKHDLGHCEIMFHKFRHCYATHLVDCGVDINVISKLLGHKNITTTAAVYAKVNIEPKIEAIKLHSKYINKLFINNNKNQ